MILPDHEIKKLCERPDAPLVMPYDAALVNPASIDLRLGNTLRRPDWRWNHDSATTNFLKGVPHWDDHLVTFDVYDLMPGEFVLCHSLEIITIPDDCVGALYSKSSTGRIGLEHLHAGFFDPGFSGAATFEFHNVAPWPIKLEAGKRVMQIVLDRMDSAPARSYRETGRYQHQRGPEPQRPERPE